MVKVKEEVVQRYAYRELLYGSGERTIDVVLQIAWERGWRVHTFTIGGVLFEWIGIPGQEWQSPFTSK